MKLKNEIPVLLLTGYLGSGKTTLLNRILTNERGIRFAVIVNDIGEVNIDASLIQKGGVVGQDASSQDLVALQNGCICCTLKMDLVKQLADLAESGKFDYIVIEASGICEPAPIAQTICAISQMAPQGTQEALPRLDCIATVVDALRMQSEFACGERLTAGKPAEEDIESLVIEQIEFCNVIVLNKISEVTPEQAGRIRAVIRALQPKAEIIECDYCDFDLDRILNTGMFDFENVATSATWVHEIEAPIDEHDHDDDDDDDHDHDGHHHHHHHDHEVEEEHHHGHHHHHHHHHDGEGEVEEYGIQTMVYFNRRPLDLAKFDRFVATQWPKEVIRAKGVIYFSNNTDMSYLFEQAGVQKKLTEAGLWFATAPAEELERMMAMEPQLRRDWDETYGDRMLKVVFIGQHLDKAALTAALDACLA